MSYQKVIIQGHVGGDPKPRFFPSGDESSKFSVAVSEKWKTKEGEQKEKTTWFTCTASGELAKACNQYLRKGSEVLIDGKIQTGEYTDKDGVKRYTWELRADVMRMVGGKKDGEQSNGNSASKPAQNQSRSSQGAGPVTDDFVDDIPFARISNKLAMSI